LTKISPKQALLKAIPLNPKTGRPIRTPKGKDVIYGYKDSSGKITPLDMEAQRFTKKETRQLQSIINRNKLTVPASTTFFMTKTIRVEKYVGGEKIKERVYDKNKEKYVIKTIKAKKGETKYIYRDGKKAFKAKTLKVVFKPPTHRMDKGKKAPPIYKKIDMQLTNKGFKYHTADWRLQERSTFERKNDQIIASTVKLKKMELLGAKQGFKTGTVTVRGKTLNNTLSTIRPPDGYEALKKKKISSIGMSVDVMFKEGDKWVKLPPMDIQAVPISGYGELNTILGKSIRTELMSKGKIFTKLNTMQKIKNEIKSTAKKKGESYHREWQKVGKIFAGGKWHDMTTVINKAKRKKYEFQEIKSGNLKVDVTYRYYTGMESM